MNIIYVENVRIPSERAHAYQIVQTCAWLVRLGHHVTLVNPDRAGHNDISSWYGLPHELVHHRRLTCWDPLSGKFPIKALAYVLQRWSFTRVLRAWARKQTADVWYTRDPAMIDALYGVVNGPWILECHDAPDAHPPRWKRIQSLVKGFVAISNGMAAKLRALGVEDGLIHVAPDGYDTQEFAGLISRDESRQALGIPSEAVVTLYVGSLYPWKGVDLAVGAWDGTPDTHHLVVIGGPDADYERLKKRIPQSVRSRVHILPTMPRVDVMRWYPAADIALLTSSPQHRIAREYTSPIKQFEYLAAGIPVLASDVPSSHEILNASVARFFTPTRELFLSALQSMIADREWRATASQAAKVLVQPYSWERRSMGIAEFLNTL
jgi:glycosyltransferase involved in cell wall biosynthesis